MIINLILSGLALNEEKISQLEVLPNYSPKLFSDHFMAIVADKFPKRPVTPLFSVTCTATSHVATPEAKRIFASFFRC